MRPAPTCVIWPGCVTSVRLREGLLELLVIPLPQLLASGNANLAIMRNYVSRAPAGGCQRADLKAGVKGGCQNCSARFQLRPSPSRSVRISAST
jgi:hypothetical protein